MPFTTTLNLHAVGRKPMPEPAGSEVVSIRVTAIVNGTGAAADVIPLAKLPAGCIPIDWEIDNDDLDTGTATLTLDLGVVVAGAVSSAAANGGKWLTASTFGQAIAYTERRAQAAAAQLLFARMSADVNDRAIGLVVIAAGNAAASANAVVGMKFTYRSSYHSN